MLTLYYSTVGSYLSGKSKIPTQIIIIYHYYCYYYYYYNYYYYYYNYNHEICDLEAELLDMVCHDIAVKHTLQPPPGKSSTGELMLHRTLVSTYRDLTPNQVYKLHEDEKKRKYASRVLEVEQGTFTPLVFTTTRGVSDKCQR